MIRIENISVKDKYSISLCFNKDYTKEYISFVTEMDRREFFSKGIYEKSENKNFKRNFGTFIEDSLYFAESDNLRAVRKCADGLAEVLRQGRGLDQIEPYKAEMFRIYNGSDNIVEQYVILKLWHELCVRHKEINAILNTMRRNNWEKIGNAYAEFADKMLMPFEKPFTSVDDVKELSGSVRTEVVEIEKSAAVCYTCEEDILPLYILYFTELSQRNKHILTCDVCGRKFVASRKDTKVCGNDCKTVKQKGYNKTHKAKAKSDPVEIRGEQARDGYDNFLKKWRKKNISDEMLQSFIDVKKAFLAELRKKKKLYKEGKLKKREVLDWISDEQMKRLDLEEKMEKDFLS